MTPPAETGGKVSQSTVLVAIADFAQVFRGADWDTAFATFEVNAHRETWPVRSKGFRRWLARRFFELEKKPPGAQALADALNVIEARAQFQGVVHPVYVRVAPGPDESIFIDLGADDWRTVQITPDGWWVRADAPVKFRRARGMLPLPVPNAGGSLAELRPFVNVKDDDQWTLLIAWLVGALRQVGPYPVLVLGGEHGAAKSTTARVFRRLVDPNSAELRAEPTDVRDVMIAATNGWLINLDNVSHLPPWLSDCLCRLATGGGFATRELYTDADEMIFEAQRPVILNGIEEVVTRGDLLDRSILLTLPDIDAKDRRPEKEFWRAFGAAQPRLLGALFDAVTVALRRGPTVTLSRAPRMADFALWATAAAPALGWSDGHFIKVYNAACAAAHELALDASPIASSVQTMVSKGEWAGTATELLVALMDITPEAVRRGRDWPKTGRALSGALRRIAAELRAVGIDVAFDEREPRTRRRLITMRRTSELPTGPPVPPAERAASSPPPAPPPTTSTGGDFTVPTVPRGAHATAKSPLTRASDEDVAGDGLPDLGTVGAETGTVGTEEGTVCGTDKSPSELPKYAEDGRYGEIPADSNSTEEAEWSA